MKNLTFSRWLRAIVLIAAEITFISPAQANEPGLLSSVRTVLIHVQSAQVDVHGSGAWISEDKILTAAHLFYGIRPDEPVSIDVFHAGFVYKASITRAEDPAALDLALLTLANVSATEGSWAPSTIEVCRSPLAPAQPVTAAIYLSQGMPLAIPTYGSPDHITWRNGIASVTAITAYLPHGASGGAIYDEENSCLAGVISKEYVATANAASIYVTTFVPASEIYDFLKH